MFKKKSEKIKDDTTVITQGTSSDIDKIQIDNSEESNVKEEELTEDIIDDNPPATEPKEDVVDSTSEIKWITDEDNKEFSDGIREKLLTAESFDSFSQEEKDWIVRNFGDGISLEPPQKKLHKWPLQFAIVNVIILSIIWVIVQLIRLRFPPDTFINGHDVGTLTLEQANDILKEDMTAGEIEVKWADGTTETIPMETLNCELTTEPELSTFLTSSKPYLWIPAFSKQNTYGVSIKIQPNDEKLLEAIKSLNCVKGVGTTEPENAKVVKKDGKYVVREGVDGTRVDPDALFLFVKNHLIDGDTTIELENSGTFAKPSITGDDERIKKIIEDAEKFENLSVKLDLDGITEDINWNVFGEWVSYKEGKFVLDHNKLKEYLTSLADKYDTLGKTRSFTTANGELISVGGGVMDNYGYKMNREQTFKDVLSAIDSFKNKTIKATWEESGITHGMQNDFGDTYIEVSIDNQHMWYKYKGQIVFDTDVVTGMMVEEKRRTPKGAFKILDKLKDHTMTGSYGSSYCNYCIAITWDGVCIHDSTWRDNYGGQIYIENGSHGCVNTPLGKMAELYDSEGVVYGIPVIVY